MCVFECGKSSEVKNQQLYTKIHLHIVLLLSNLNHVKILGHWSPPWCSGHLDDTNKSIYPRSASRATIVIHKQPTQATFLVGTCNIVQLIIVNIWLLANGTPLKTHPFFSRSLPERCLKNGRIHWKKSLPFGWAAAQRPKHLAPSSPQPSTALRRSWERLMWCRSQKTGVAMGLQLPQLRLYIP